VAPSPQDAGYSAHSDEGAAMTRLLRLTTVVAVTAGLLASAAPAQAAPPPARAVVLTASAQYAVYAVKASAKHLNPGNPNRGALYAVDAKGHRQALPAFKNAGRQVQLVGSSLVQARQVYVPDGSYQVVRYLDLRTGRAGEARLSDGDAALTAAPGGFVRAHRTGETTALGEPQTLSLQTYDGTQTALGDPFPDGIGYSLVAGDGGLLAATATSDETPNADARIRYMSWSTPGTWRTLYDAHGERYVGCSAPSRTSVVCSSMGLDAEVPQLGLFRLRDGAVTWLRKAHPKVCTHLDWATSGANLVAIETSDAGACTRGRLIRFSASGALVGSARRYSAIGGVTVGLGRILVSRDDQRVLYSLTGVTRTPQVLVPRSAIDRES
jgi:hypothetical protein